MIILGQWDHSISSYITTISTDFHNCNLTPVDCEDDDQRRSSAFLPDHDRKTELRINSILLLLLRYCTRILPLDLRVRFWHAASGVVYLLVVADCDRTICTQVPLTAPIHFHRLIIIPSARCSESEIVLPQFNDRAVVEWLRTVNAVCTNYGKNLKWIPHIQMKILYSDWLDCGPSSTWMFKPSLGN